MEEILFSLVYDMKGVIPLKIQKPTIRSKIKQKDNNDLRKDDILLVEEKRENAMIQFESQKRIIKRSYNRFIKHKNFNIGDWAQWKALGNNVEATYGLSQHGKAYTKYVISLHEGLIG